MIAIFGPTVSRFQNETRELLLFIGPELKFAVQHGLGMKALMGCLVCMSFSGSVV